MWINEKSLKINGFKAFLFTKNVIKLKLCTLSTINMLITVNKYMNKVVN